MLGALGLEGPKSCDTVVKPQRQLLARHLFPAADGERVDMKSLLQVYRDWCADNGVAPVDLDQFVDEMEALCGKLGVKIEAGEDQRIYCHGIRIERTPATIA